MYVSLIYINIVRIISIFVEISIFDIDIFIEISVFSFNLLKLKPQFKRSITYFLRIRNNDIVHAYNLLCTLR